MHDIHVPKRFKRLDLFRNVSIRREGQDLIYECRALIMRFEVEPEPQVNRGPGSPMTSAKGSMRGRAWRQTIEWKRQETPKLRVVK